MSKASVWHDISSKSIVTTLSEAWESLVFRVKEYTKETVEHLIITLIVYSILCVLLYTGIVHWKVFTFKSDVKNPKRVLLVIAHPDDECMFFGPTVLNFTSNKNCTLYLMCLSTGRNYGMGTIRKNELYESCKLLGIDENCIFIHNHTLLPDSMKVKWPIDILAKQISYYLEAYDITTLVTFDRHGVSRHLNHSSIYYAVAHLTLEKRIPAECNVYVLETVNLFRKYWLFLDIPLCYLLSNTRYILTFKERSVIHKAMRQHQSQLLWYRRLYMYFSRYMITNTLQEMDLTEVELELEIDY